MKQVIVGVPQGSMDGPFLFNLFVNDVILFICFSTLSNYADDNNLFATETDTQLINQMLLSNFRTVKNWFYENFMIFNLENAISSLLARILMTNMFFSMITLPSKIAMKRKY